MKEIPAPCCEGSLEFHNAIEVGNIFKLGTKYTKTMEMKYLDEKGKEQYPIMGCYGIGSGTSYELCYGS